MTSFAFVLLAAWCATLTVIDLRTRRLPNVLTGIGAAAVLGYAAGSGRLGVALGGALLLALPYLLVHLLAPTACGAGDAKLAVGLGAAAGLGGSTAWVAAALGGPLLTAAVGLVVLGARGPAARGSPADRRLPHGPAMCAATLLALLPVAG
ncbi:prepilin peptidase [Nocardia farcinica]|uniref:prepilin peptidase n=1 Tax=Nocardia farcinica TaxID=37329 RepID=UPI00189434D0|nr:prepilin peptidase [Nocardia farcinica]MBF6360075.1 prepilin peptidase [Nocardia farcinica]